MKIKNIFTKMAATVATGAVLSVAIAANAPKAEAASYKLSWKGEQGYTATGAFSFSKDLLGGLVTENELSDFMISFFDPMGNLLQAFDYNFPNPDTTGEFNFNFDPVTEMVLQSGESDGSNGFDLGIDFAGGEVGIGFFSGEPSIGVPAGLVTLSLDNDPPGASTTLDQGGMLVATSKSVPEPASALGLLAFSAFSASFALKKKQAS